MIRKIFVKKLFCLMLTAFIAGTGLFFISCGGDSGGDSTPVTLKKVTISGTAKVGETVTAIPTDTSGKTGSDVTGVTYQWQSADSKDGEFTAIDGATAQSFEISAEYVDKYLKVVATKSNTPEESDVVGPVTITEIETVTISGTEKVGETLTASAKDTDGDETGAGVTYQWQRASSRKGEYSDIDGATESTYVLTDDDFDMYVRVVATKNNRSKESDPTEEKITRPSIESVEISGTAKVGSALSATAKDSDNADITANESVSYQWYANTTASGTFTAIDGATASSYTLTASEAGKYIKVTATLNGKSVTSEVAGPVYITTVKSVLASGDAKVGATLTAVPTDTDDSSDETGITYQWYYSSTQTIGEPISGATEKTYRIAPAYAQKYIGLVATKNGGSAQYVTTVVQNGTLSSDYTLRYNDGSIDSIVVLKGASLANDELGVTGLKDSLNSDWSVTASSVEFSNTNALESSQKVNVTISASGYDSIVKQDIFITVQAQTPTREKAPALLSGTEAQAQILQGCVKFNVTDTDSGKYEYSVNGTTWTVLTAETAEVRVGTATEILVRVAAVGEAGSVGYIAASEGYSLEITDSHRGNKPSLFVSVSISGDITVTKDTDTQFTASDGYTDYAWSFSELDSDKNTSITLSNDSKTASVSTTDWTAGTYYLTVTAKEGGSARSSTVTITVSGN